MVKREHKTVGGTVLAIMTILAGIDQGMGYLERIADRIAGERVGTVLEAREMGPRLPDPIELRVDTLEAIHMRKGEL